VDERRKAFLRKWRMKCRAVPDGLEASGDKLLTFTRFPKDQWKSNDRSRRKTVLPSAESAAMLFWALLASGQITMGKIDGWESLAEKLRSDL
jgi:putative transposase